jgi:adenine deaminase
MPREDRMAVARGEKPADLILTNCHLVNVFSGQVEDTDIVIRGSRVAALMPANPDGPTHEAQEILDLGGAYVCPGFIDAHVHLESSMVQLREFIRAVLPRGTTTIVIDPHEIANVLGLDGIRYLLEAAKYNPLSVFMMAPSCVPSTHLETAGARLMSYDLEPLLSNPWVIGLGEVMNYPGVLSRDKEVMAKLKIAQASPIDGHAPGLSGRDLNAYIAAGIRSEHEATRLEEAREKLQKGMHVFIREGTNSRDLHELLPLVTSANSRRCCFCTDDRDPATLLREGHMDSIVRESIQVGLDPIIAIQMATLNPAERFKLSELGVIAPGRRADMVIFDNFQDFNVLKVYRGGRLMAEGGHLAPHVQQPPPITIRSSMNVRWLQLEDFVLPAESDRARIIGIIPRQIITRQQVDTVRVVDGRGVADPARDILKVCVVERHQATGNIGKGFVSGFGIQHGAIASSVAHDSHNIVVVGASDYDIYTAAVAVVRMRGGQVVVSDGQVIARLSLPIAGLMSDQPLETVQEQVEQLNAAARSLGCVLDDPLMTMSFLSLPVIPELKLTDQGLVDVNKFDFVPVFVS